jgi:hypothetical protein
MDQIARLGFAILCLALAGYAAPAGEKKPSAEKKADPPLVILDANGKEVKLPTWHFTAGTRRVPGLDGDVPKPPPWPGGPQYLEFREERSTTYKDGILTLVPVKALRQLDYDYERKTVTAVVAVAGGKDENLAGATKYQGINRLTIEGDADLGDLGFASIKFLGGSPKGGITAVRFPAPQPAPAAEGPAATVIAADKEKTKHPVAGLTALYLRPDGSYHILPQLMFKKSVKIDLAKIAALRHVEAEDKKQTSFDFDVVLRDGQKLTLTLLTKVELESGKSATLAGLLGRVPVGYKLFPAHTVAELRMPEEKK